MTSERFGRQLGVLAATFITLQGLVLTLSPAVRERTWATGLRYTHWIGILVWVGATLALHWLQARKQPDADPLLLPVCAVLAGWGLLTIWRLEPAFGLRQAAWLALSAAAIAWLCGRWGDLRVLRRYRSVLLATGLALTALTIVLGTSPTGVGPRLWLGCCGIYFQPSEPLKLLLVVYLAAYLGDQANPRGRMFPMLVPTLVIAGIALTLLLVQRDLGSASILIVLFTMILFLATGRRRVLIATMVFLGVAALTGYFFVGIVHARLVSWVNPWLDPTGQSYQIVQSLLSVANGGILGRGLGIGNPGLVPVALSDFVYTAIAEESGLAGSLAVLALFAILLGRGLLISMRATDRFHRLLAAGLTAYLAIQSLLIIGGDLRMLPLTGVTLPFVSYGGSSLLTASIAVAMLSTISAQPRVAQNSVPSRGQLLVTGAALGIALLSAGFFQAWWSVVRGPDLLSRTDNARRVIADRFVPRGALLDRNDTAISQTQGSAGDFERVYWYEELAPVTGYTHPVYGQAGLEASFDEYLRGLRGNPVGSVIWEQLVYGTPPAGLDVRLTLDLRLQELADAAMGTHAGAVVLLNAHSGDVLVMASHPAFDPNRLDELGPSLAKHHGTPLVNRAAQGTYQLGNALLPMLAAAHKDTAEVDVASVYRALGLAASPQIGMAVSAPFVGTAITDWRVSPLQMAIAAASLSNAGIRPAPHIALGVRSPSQGWVILPSTGEPVPVFSAQAATNTALEYTGPLQGMWQWRSGGGPIGDAPAATWYLAGTQPGGAGASLAVVVVLEDGDTGAASQIGLDLLAAVRAQ